jgi:hypothetical protein
MKNAMVQQVKQFIRSPYAWPGGYPLMLIMEDSEVLCYQCTKNNFKVIALATQQNLRDGWQAAAIDVNWEDENLQCGECNSQIESAYGE